MEIHPVFLITIPPAFTLLGIVIASLFNQHALRITKESEERKHHKEIVVQAAIENWKQTADIMIKGNTLGQMSPVDVFMVHMAALADVVFDPTTDTNNLHERLAKVDKLTNVASKSRKDMQRIN